MSTLPAQVGSVLLSTGVGSSLHRRQRRERNLDPPAAVFEHAWHLRSIGFRIDTDDVDDRAVVRHADVHLARFETERETTWREHLLGRHLAPAGRARAPRPFDEVRLRAG